MARSRTGFSKTDTVINRLIRGAIQTGLFAGMVYEADDEEAAAKRDAEAEKKLGSEAYKKRDLDAAQTHFSKAWEVWPKDITFLTNLSGRHPTPSSPFVY